MGACRFGRCSFEAAAQLLVCDGREIALTAKGCELLTLLLEHPNAVVASEELRERLWPQGFVEAGNLAQQVYLLRRALAVDDSVAIENVARRGYRLRADIPAAQPPAPAVTANPTTASGPAPRSRRPVRSLASLAVAVLILAVLPTSSSERRSQSIVDAPALRAFALGRYFWERRGSDNLNRAEVFFEEAVAAAPGSALGYAGLADVWGVRADDVPMGKPLHRSRALRALAEAKTAVARDPQSAVAHAALGLALIEMDAPSTQGMGELRSAIALDPNNAEAHEWYAIRLLGKGDVRDAALHFEAAAQVQPENVAVASWHAWSRYYLNDPVRAVADFQTALAINPSYEMAQVGLISVLVEAGHFREAQRELRRVHATDWSTARAFRALETMADLGLGQRTAADAEVRRLQAEDRRRLSGDADEFVVAALAKVGQPEEARRVRDQMHLETKPEERTMIDHDPLVGPVFRRLASKV